MPVLPIAAFLAGALLSLLLPALLLIALVLWYWAVVARVPGPLEPSDPGPGDSAPPAD